MTAPQTGKFRQTLDALKLRENWMSYALIGSFVLMYCWELWLNYTLNMISLRADSRVLLYLGANFPPALLNGEYWRALASCFLHIDGLHLLMNSMALYYFGPLLERSFGHWKLLLAFVLTGVIGSLTSMLLHLQDPYLSAGASGGLYGLFGVIFVAGKRYRDGLPKSFQTWLNQTMGAMIIFSFIPNIDIWAHFGGLASGLVLGWVYKPLPHPDQLDFFLESEPDPPTEVDPLPETHSEHIP